MATIAARYAQLMQAYSRLDYMTKKFVQLSQLYHGKSIPLMEENELIAHRDAVIKRFEFCYDLTWKFFKSVLRERYSIDVPSPRKVFQESYQQGLLTRDEAEQLLEMVDARNETTHVYDEAVADAISQKIVGYYAFLAGLLEKIKPLIVVQE